MLYVVVTNGKHHETLECGLGANIEAVMAEKYEGWISLGSVDSLQEARSLIESDRAKHKLDSY